MWEVICTKELVIISSKICCHGITVRDKIALYLLSIFLFLVSHTLFFRCNLIL
jgi:hypothetical protein